MKHEYHEGRFTFADNRTSGNHHNDVVGVPFKFGCHDFALQATALGFHSSGAFCSHLRMGMASVSEAAASTRPTWPFWCIKSIIELMLVTERSFLAENTS
jgi:hypothetical protein